MDNDWIYRSKRYNVIESPDRMMCDGIIQIDRMYCLIPCDGCTEEEFKLIVLANLRVLTAKSKATEITRQQALSILYEDVPEHNVLYMIDSSEWCNYIGLNLASHSKDMVNDIVKNKTKQKSVDNIDVLQIN